MRHISELDQGLTLLSIEFVSGEVVVDQACNLVEFLPALKIGS